MPNNKVRQLWRAGIIILLIDFSHSSTILKESSIEPKVIASNPLQTSEPSIVKFGPTEADIVRGRPSSTVVLPCRAMNSTYPTQEISWFYLVSNWIRNGSYKILNATGDLLLIDVSRELVERYECIASNEFGVNKTDSIYFRLDYSFWYAHEWNSLFYGSCLSALVICAASFILNLIWIVCRKTILWWLNRAERMHRVRSMVEAMEKYRQKQMENLHETYHRRIAAVRDNYHQQVEQIRHSYANQADRFRDYRQEKKTQMENQTEKIRENYNQQMARIRDFGSRRAEQLWESYERQLNRMRMFTLERRLKVMRQYKVKQRYINKLLESIGDTTNNDTITKQEAAIRAVLAELPQSSFPTAAFSRSASYYSLPEFVEEDPGDMIIISRDDSGPSSFGKSNNTQPRRSIISKNARPIDQRINLDYPSTSKPTSSTHQTD
uniref:Ig-like domain-containing protein n=1 Tax=Ditylenchus dipsaci TaxID=166011 RepID=A0A915EBX5_9BILA